jgi:hypothetical protein
VKTPTDKIYSCWKALMIIISYLFVTQKAEYLICSVALMPLSGYLFVAKKPEYFICSIGATQQRLVHL